MANSYLPENPPPYSKTSTTSIEVEKTTAEEEVQQNLLNSIIDEKPVEAVKGGDQQNQAQQKSTAERITRSCCGIDIGNRRGKVRLLLLIISLLIFILGSIQLLYLHLYQKPRNLKMLAAVEENDLDTVQQMLEADATLNVNARFPEYQGRAALHLAAQHGFVDMARLLLAHHANATLRTSGPHWQSPLHVAANSACRAPMVKLLLDAGATPEDKDGAGRQAIDYAGTSPECKSAMYERSYRKRWAEDWARKTARVQALQKSIGEGGFLANGDRWKSHMKDMLGILAPEMYGKKGEEEEVV